MIQAADDDPDISESLALLSALPMVTAVTIQGPGTHGGIQIIVRKAGQQRKRRTLYRYSWEAWGGAAGHAWKRTGGLAYDSAAAAYQGAVQAVQAARHSQD